MAGHAIVIQTQGEADPSKARKRATSGSQKLIAPQKKLIDAARTDVMLISPINPSG
jgi:hypothetical protein